MADLGVDVWSESAVGVGDGIDVDVPAIEDDEGRFSFKVGERGVDGDGAAFAGREPDVVIGECAHRAHVKMRGMN